MALGVDRWQCPNGVERIFVAQENELLQFRRWTEVRGIGDDGEEMLVKNLQDLDQRHGRQLHGRVEFARQTIVVLHHVRIVMVDLDVRRVLLEDIREDMIVT